MLSAPDFPIQPQSVVPEISSDLSVVLDWSALEPIKSEVKDVFGWSALEMLSAPESPISLPIV